jgi:hypothetical protein
VLCPPKVPQKARKGAGVAREKEKGKAEKLERMAFPYLLADDF